MIDMVDRNIVGNIPKYNTSLPSEYLYFFFVVFLNYPYSLQRLFYSTDSKCGGRQFILKCYQAKHARRQVSSAANFVNKIYKYLIKMNIHWLQLVTHSEVNADPDIVHNTCW